MNPTDYAALLVRIAVAVVWIIVTLEAIVHKDRNVYANRPRRILLMVALTLYAIVFVVGGLSPTGVFPPEGVRFAYTVVQAFSGLVGLSLLLAPDVGPKDKEGR